MFYKVIDDTLVLSKKSSLMIKEELKDLFPSRKLIYSLLNEATLNDKRIINNPLFDGELKIPLHYISCPKEDLADIVYEDEFFVVAYKPKELLVHSDGNNDITLTELVSKTVGYKVQAAHRLDYLTDGLVLFLKTPILEPYIDVALQRKDIKRVYYALCKTKNKPLKEYCFKDKIGKDRHDAHKRRVSKTGQEAITHVQTIAFNKQEVLFRCTLQTGRTHQIRVHLSYHHFPIINDPLYGIKDKNYDDMALTAYQLSFYHPLKEEMITLTSPIKNDYLRKYKEVLK